MEISPFILQLQVLFNSQHGFWREENKKAASIWGSLVFLKATWGMFISKTKDPKTQAPIKSSIFLPDWGRQPICDQHRNFTGSKHCVTVVADAVQPGAGRSAISDLGKKLLRNSSRNVDG